MANILLTGACGFIGSHLYDQFKKEHNVTCVDNLVNNVVTNTFNNNIDIRNYTELNKLFYAKKFDIVCHQAALNSVPLSFTRSEDTYDVNSFGTLNLIRLCKKYFVKRFIFASSSSIYGNSPYGISKLVAEKMLHHSGLNYVTLRYFNVFGPRQKDTPVISNFVSRIKNNKDIVVYGDGKVARDFCYIKNVIEANEKALYQYKSGTYEIGMGKSTTINQLIDYIKLVVNPGYVGKIYYEPERKNDIKLSKAEPTDVYSYSLEEGLVDWLK